MAAPTVEYDAVFPGGVIDAATAVFVRHHYVFGRLWKWVLTAALVNVVAFCGFLIFGTDATTLTISGAIAALGPLYFLQTYVFTPRAIASRLKQRLAEPVRIVVDEEKISVTNKGQTLARPWSEWKAVCEYPEYFLLVFSASAFFPLPKQNMPSGAQALLRARLR